MDLAITAEIGLPFSRRPSCHSLHFPMNGNAVDNSNAVFCPQTSEDDRVLLDI